MLAENRVYLDYVRQIGPQGKDRMGFLRAFYEQELEFLQGVEFKPVTLRKLVQYFNL